MHNTLANLFTAQLRSDQSPARAETMCGTLQGQAPGIRFAIVLWGEPNDKCRTLLDCPVLSFADVLAKGHRVSATFSPPPTSADQLATIVYTSGTTGKPKVCGVP